MFDGEFRHIVAKWTPVIVLLAMAGMYSVLVYGSGYNLWAGPNFAMFANAEGPETRVIRCELVGDARERPVRCPSSLERAAFRAKRTPTRPHLRSVANGLAAWAESEANGTSLSGVSGVRAELWQLEYAPSTGEAVFRRKLTVTREFAGGAR